MRVEPKWIFWGSITFIVIGVLVAIAADTLFERQVERVDDLLTSVGTFGIGVGAYLTGRAALKRADEAHDKAERNGNGQHALEQKEEIDTALLHEQVHQLQQTVLQLTTPGGEPSAWPESST